MLTNLSQTAQIAGSGLPNCRKVYSDSREKYGDDWVELGHKNEEYRKTGGFQSLKDNGNW